MKKVFPKVNLNYQHFKLNLPELKIETLGLKTFTLIAYSLTPVYISMIVSGVFPGLSELINLFGLYGFIIYWLGAEVLIDDMIPKNRNLFIILSLTIFVALFLVLRLGMKSLFELFL
jgi:apolipoprotein N-acyltransferase